MRIQPGLALAALVLSTTATAQPPAVQLQVATPNVTTVPATDSFVNFSSPGNTCANIYVFDPNTLIPFQGSQVPELIACCSLPAPAGGSGNISVQNLAVGNTLTGRVPTSVILEVLGTQSSGGMCVSSAAQVASPGVVFNPVTIGSSLSFSSVPLSTTTGPTNLATLGEFCTSNLANGSGFGICQTTLAPIISKSFVPSQFIGAGTPTLTFSVTNPNTTGGSLTGVAFTDSLPAGLVVANPSNLSSTCGGTANATPGSATISLSGGAIPAGSACTVTATVAAGEGIYVNSVQVTSTNGGIGNTSSATLFVATPPHLKETFGALSIGSLGTTSLTFTLTNPNQFVTLTGIGFSDPPPGLVVATPNGLTGSCDGGVITAVPGSSSITLSGATLAPQSSCTFGVNVVSDGTTLGYVTTTTSAVTSNEALPANASPATIFIGNPFLVTYKANLNIGESYIDIANAGANGAALMGPGFGAATGNICANVYAFDPGEELIACCSCLITPDQTVSLGVNTDLVSNTLTGVKPASVTVKLLDTLAGGDGTGTSCSSCAASVTGAVLANGIAAWGTTLHATPAAGIYTTTETPFTPSTLSAGELASLGGRCASIIANGSGFGICTSCQAGPQGASKLP